MSDAQPRHAYVYAVALDSRGKTKQAIRELSKANLRWPNQYDLLMTLVTYMDKTGNVMAIKSYLDKLKPIAPQSPQLLQLQLKYGR